jgi:hypothetical protein
MGTVRHSKLFWYTISLCIVDNKIKFTCHRPVLDTLTPSALRYERYTKRAVSAHLINQLGQMCRCYVWTYISGLLEGYRRWCGYILAQQRNPDLHGFCSIANLRIISDRSEQNSSKLRDNISELLMGRSASLKGSLPDSFIGPSANIVWKAPGPPSASPTSATTKAPFVDTMMKIQVTEKTIISRPAR